MPENESADASPIRLVTGAAGALATLARNIDGLRYRPTTGGRPPYEEGNRQHSSHRRQVHEVRPLHSSAQAAHSQRPRRATAIPRLQALRSTGRHYIGQGEPFHQQLLDRPLLPLGGKAAPEHRLPPADRRTDRAPEPVARTLPPRIL